MTNGVYPNVFINFKKIEIEKYEAINVTKNALNVFNMLISSAKSL